MLKNRAVRRRITRESHPYFFSLYFAHYVKFPSAPFQHEIFALTEDDSQKLAAIIAFRGSAKSTIITTSYPIWAVLGKLEKKFVLIICQTRTQAKQHLMNLRQELETNDLLKNDLGPFQEESDEWGSTSLVFSKFKARITVASSEQSIRGLRHRQHRPDLIICDDVEDMQSVKTREGRHKTYNWFKSEVIPVGDQNTKIVLIGNLLHEDSLLMRVKEDMDEGRMTGTFRMYPIQDEEGVILWPGKFPDEAAVEYERKRVGDDVAWMREYMLRIVGDYTQIVHRDDIQYYDELPDPKNLQTVRIGVDLAISKKSTADYTAMVIGHVYAYSGPDRYYVYIDPLVINRRIDFTETIGLCKQLNQTFAKRHYPHFLVESVGYQGAVPEVLQRNGLHATAVSVGNQDKSSRLHIASHLLKTGNVLFPRNGGPEVKQLIEQLVGFGVEKHDDLVDAFSILITNVLEDPPPFYHIRVISYNDLFTTWN